MPKSRTDHRDAAVEGETSRLVQTAECSWDDLDLSPRVEKKLREISRRARAHRPLAALVSGPAGAGKSLAAGCVAGELHRQLLHVRLSAMKAEDPQQTVRELDRVFAATDPDTTVLFFDEAEALFSQRGEAPRNGDGFSPLESHFLRNLENFPGLALLATHRCKRINPLLARRFHYAVNL